MEMKDDMKFDAWISSVAPAINEPPATPRADMWAAIEAAAAATPTPSEPAIRVIPIRRARWLWPTAIAAALVLGIGLDRMALRNVKDTRDTSSPAPLGSVASTGDPAKLYRLAAVQTLSQAEALLTAYRASEFTKRDPAAARQLGLWGRQVLSSTRLLLDSPAGDDAQLHALLDDLEMVLVQVIQLSGTPLDASERALIDRAMRDHDLLPRIRTAVPAGSAASAGIPSASD
jgi:hypothetical protein